MSSAKFCVLYFFYFFCGTASMYRRRVYDGVGIFKRYITGFESFLS